MRLISNLKFPDGPDVASPPSTNSRGKSPGKASAGPKVGNLLSGKRVPVNCQEVGQDSSNEIFYKGREILQEYQKMMQGHPNLTDFSTHPSDHTNLIGRNQPGELENLDSSFSLGLHVILGQLNAPYDSPITAFACTDRASCLKREDLLGSDHGFMASGHADGAIILYKVCQVDAEDLTGPHSEENNNRPQSDKVVELFSSESNAPVSVSLLTPFKFNPV
ncbi:hypothetical protein DSO57_1015012 [Entomophthora muscae]|uniref:Uncharacterized protein n=1 Tax=Entomophthora muscae TaxID=34485 RepID=A0ACC2S706_9FUNG|nr:hypothetical protein DSO57_1015012 [Entomophthora muscae]